MSRFTPMELVYDEFIPSKKNSLPDIILLHGATSCRQTWHNIAKTLATQTRRRVFTIDARNHGDNDWTDVFNFQVMVKDLDHFMQERDINTAAIIGHSMGGKTAMKFALEQPEKVDKLVVEDCTPKPLPAETMKYISMKIITRLIKGVELIPPDVDLATAKKMASDFRFQNEPEEYATAPERRDNGVTLPLEMKDGRYAWKTNVAVLEKFLADPDTNKTLEGSYPKPALFIYGTRSPFNISRDEDEIVKLFPKAKLTAVEGATHLVHSEYPDEFCKIVSEFLMDS